MVPPVSWKLLLEEVRRYVIKGEYSASASDDALDTVLEDQGGAPPDRGRHFPDTRQLPHDFVAWHSAMLEREVRRAPRRLAEVAPPLRQFPAARFTVDDPYDVCLLGIGHTVESDIWGVWELTSSVSRPVVPLHAASSALPARRPAPLRTQPQPEAR